MSLSVKLLEKISISEIVWISLEFNLFKLEIFKF